MPASPRSLLDLLTPPPSDPTLLFDLFRGHAATELLTVAVEHLKLFELVGAQPVAPDVLQGQLSLAKRPFSVLIVALRAFGLLTVNAQGQLEATALARLYLSRSSQFDISGYIGLATDSPGVLAMRDRMLSNRPAATGEAEPGAAFIFREGLPSAMEDEQTARSLTLALAGRARNVAPVLVHKLPLADAQVLLDVAGGSGLYAIAYLQKHPALRAIVWDRPAVLQVAREMAEAAGVADRLQCRAGDMFVDEVPEADVALLSNVLHDWDVPQCQHLLTRVAHMLPASGRLIVHDVFLNDELDGPLAVALYSADLFLLTEGRAYSRAEYAAWLHAVGLVPEAFATTLVHAGALVGRKP